MDDPVNNPPHYNTGSIQCIDAMKAMAEGCELNISNHAQYCWQNAFKYLWRFPYKNAGLQDLRKCRFYLDRLISEIEDLT
ncbi:MAG TPA: hypothetical protein DCW52_05130 [Gammaproteobacteria bacterium]|nr:hypothetical protein [Gammaproteobacteria bacterium]